MIERPILFSAPMVQALLNDTKTQTRRVAKLTANGHVKEPGGHRRWHPADPDAHQACPYGQPGDRLWVRESCRLYTPVSGNYQAVVRYAADGNMGLLPDAIGHWSSKPCPSIHMPRWASRITLEITEVRVERLQDISQADAIAEGIERDAFTDDWSNYGQGGGTALTPKGSYSALWESINGPGSWAANPWVWVVEFKRLNQQAGSGV